MPPALARALSVRKSGRCRRIQVASAPYRPASMASRSMVPTATCLTSSAKTQRPQRRLRPGSLANHLPPAARVVDATVAARCRPPPASPCASRPTARPTTWCRDPEPWSTYPWLARELDHCRGIGFLHVIARARTGSTTPSHPMMSALRDAYHGGIIAWRFQSTTAAEPIRPASPT